MLRVLVIAVALAALAAPANAADRTAKPAPAAQFHGDKTAQHWAADLKKRYGVQVLSARRDQIDGRPVYHMTVMNPGGDFNGAFEVRTLVVDAASGELVSQFQHTDTGYQLALPADRTPRDDGLGTTIRRESFAKP